MINNTLGYQGMITAPHHLAAQAGSEILREGGSAVEAMVAAAAVIAVVYPHMNAIGGDGFWLISNGNAAPVGVDACGPAANAATQSWYREQGLSSIPARGAKAALTVPGTIQGWASALAHPHAGAGRLPLARLLAPAIELARSGVAVTASQAELTAAKLNELQDIPGFADTYLTASGSALNAGAKLAQARLAATLEQLADAGLDDFYRGDLARSMAQDLTALGSPLLLEDFEGFKARLVTPLSVNAAGATLYNMPPPTQGVASLMILGLFDRLKITQGESFAHIHGLIESTKQAFRVRDAEVTDPNWMRISAEALLTSEQLDQAAQQISATTAAPWPHPAQPGDTVWLGAIDSQGRSVSFIQSIYWEYGSGIVLPETGVLMQNRGMSFGLDPTHPQALEPGRRPFHTLNPAMAHFQDGRHMVYGTMGGEGQPQTQAAVFSRYGYFNKPIQEAITAPRWLLGRTWGESTTSLKLESNFPEPLINALRQAGHEVEIVPAFNSMMGHAGGIVRHPNGLLEGGADPRSDGNVCAAMLY